MRRDKLYIVETRCRTYIYAKDKEEAEDSINEMFEELDGYKVVHNYSEIQEIEASEWQIEEDEY